MLVCPSCRASNEEGRSHCSGCGAELKPTRQLLAGRRSQPVEIDIEPPPLPKRWPRITAFVAAVLVLIAGGVYLVVQPGPCHGKFSSDQYGYCVSVPAGWSRSSARIGSLKVDQFVHHGATAVVMSVPLRPGATLQTYAALAQQQAKQAGLETGALEPTRLDGEPALEFRLITGADFSFRGLEVVSLVNDTGWTVQLNDDDVTYPSSVGSFRSMLASWHFR